MKIGFIAHKVHRHGGMERAAAEVLDRIAKEHEVIVLARECDLKQKRLTWIPIHPIPRPNLLLAWSFSQKVRHLERQLDCTLTNSVGAAAPKADVITAQFCHAAFHARYGGMRGGRGLLRRWYQYIAGRMFTRQEQAAYTAKRLKAVIAVSEGVKRELVEYYGVDEQKIRVIPNGVNHSVFKPAENSQAKRALRRSLKLPEEAFQCLFVGGDWDRKGLADAIHAVASLPDAILVVVGRGDTSRFQRVAQEAGVDNRIFFAGTSKTPQNYYAAADVFVFPSRYEAFSLVTLEAAASGLPIIALRINGTEELIQEGYNGYFAEKTFESIRQKLILLMEDHELLQKMSQAALEVSQRYTWDRIAEEQLQVFQSVSMGVRA